MTTKQTQFKTEDIQADKNNANYDLRDQTAQNNNQLRQLTNTAMQIVELKSTHITPEMDVEI